MRNSRNLLITITALNLTACMSTYVAPASDMHSAKLTIINSADASLYLMVFKDPKTCSGWQQLNIPNEKKAKYLPDYLKEYESISIDVEAEKEFSIDARAQIHTYSRRSESCRMIATFLPRKDQSYETKFFYDNKNCFLSIKRIEEKGGKLISFPEESTIQREVVAGITNAGSVCK